MKVKVKSKVTRSLAMIMAFAIALAGSILVAPKAMVYAKDCTTNVVWDVSNFDVYDTTQTNQGITFNRTNLSCIEKSSQGSVIQIHGGDATSFSADMGDISKIVFKTTDIFTHNITNSTKLSAGWTYESTNKTFTWNGTPTNDVAFSFEEEYVIIGIDSIVFTIDTHSWNEGEELISPTCTTTGKMLYTCTECGETKLVDIKATGHRWSQWEVVKAATEKEEGKESRRCYNDNCHYETRSIPKLPKLNPAPITNASVLLNTGLKSSQSGSKLTMKWGKVKGATSYEVFITDGKKFPKKPTLTTKTTKIAVKKLNGKKLNLKKLFKIYVVAKKGKSKLGKSMTCYVAGRKNAKTNATSITLKTPSEITLMAGMTRNVKASLNLQDSKKKVVAYEGVYRYLSSDKSVATVNAKGKVRAKGKGACYIFVFANDGFPKKIKVTVR